MLFRSRHHKAESKLHDLQKKVKGKGKQKETSASMTHEWHEWESTSDSDIAEQTLSKSSRKQWHHNTGAPDVPSGDLPELPDTEPVELGPHTVLPPVGSVEQAVPEPAVPTVTVMPPSTLAPSLWGEGRTPSIHHGEMASSPW